MHSGLTSAVITFALVGFVTGLSACAKYPVVTDTRASTASAPAPAPTR